MSRVLFAAALLSALLATGCFSSSTGTVTGNVTVNGKPLEKGQITFSPGGNEGGTAGGEIANGKYEVPDLAPAQYHVSVQATPDVKIVMPGDPETKRTLTDEELRARIDPLPKDTTGKEQTIDVKRGKQTLDFKLESKTGS
jgi:hypothetical protein